MSRASTISGASVLGIAGVLLLANGAQAQTVKYVDNQGVTHYVGSAQQVPEQYRGKAETPTGRGHAGPVAGSRDFLWTPKELAKARREAGDEGKDKAINRAKETKPETHALVGSTKGDVKAAKEAGAPAEPSSKGGELRGLNRADQVAGEHGKQGRANARRAQAR
jgi:hypothetical protein